jgi:glycosyltransferase involved in cell wall biosynthesis
MSVDDQAHGGPAPRVSVIIATYNWSSVLRFALQSVLWQSFQDFDVLVVGDGCTDDSGAVVAAFGDRRLHWHNLPVNSGNQSAPNNAGIKLARGRYVAYLGHDDLWHPEHLRGVVDAIERDEADLAYGLAVLIGPPGGDARIVTGVPPIGGGGKPVFVPPSSVLHRRDLTDHIGPWSDHRAIRLPTDRDFLNRAWERRQHFASSERLTVFKFPSAWRPNSYRERRCDEQAEYVRRIGAEPDFLANELLAVARSYAARTTTVDLDVPEDVRPGWFAELNRWIRGLEAEPPPAAVEELFRLRAREQELLRHVDERTAWARGLEREVGEREARVQELRAIVDERTAWAQRLDQELVTRDAQLREGWEHVEERTAWAQRLDREIAERDSLIRELQALVEERTAWAQGLDREVADRDRLIRELQARVDERTAWARDMERQLAAAADRARPEPSLPLHRRAWRALGRLLPRRGER